MSALGRSRLCENSDFEVARRISVSVSSLWEPIAPATSLGRRQLRKQFCASLAQASFHTACARSGHFRKARLLTQFAPRSLRYSADEKPGGAVSAHMGGF